MPPGADANAYARAADLLRARAVRVTRPRLELLVLLLAAQDGHLSAEALIELAVHAQPPVHRATVYRTLEGLTKAGVLGHVHLSVGPTTYRIAEQTGAGRAHAHEDELYVQCARCGRLATLPVSTWGGTAERVLARTGFVLDPTHVALSGTCPDCVAAMGALPVSAH